MKNYQAVALFYLSLFTLPASGYSLQHPDTGVWVYNLSEEDARSYAEIHIKRPKLYMSKIKSLTQAIVRHNPAQDAKREIAQGRVFFLKAKGVNHYPGAEKLEKQMDMTTLFQGGNNWQKIPVHIIRGASFDKPNEFFVDSPASKQVDIFAQAAYRYAYYWNRTVVAHLKQQQTLNQGATAGATSDTHHTNNGSDHTSESAGQSTPADAESTEGSSKNTGDNAVATSSKSNSFPYFWSQQVD